MQLRDDLKMSLLHIFRLDPTEAEHPTTSPSWSIDANLVLVREGNPADLSGSMPRSKPSDRQIQEQIARRVRQARLEKGWTQEQLAEALDVATESISRYESGRRALSISMLYRVADALGVRVELLLGRGPAGLSTKEAEIVEGWRLLDVEGQRLVRELVRWGSSGGSLSRAVAKQTSQQRRQLHSFPRSTGAER